MTTSGTEPSCCPPPSGQLRHPAPQLVTVTLLAAAADDGAAAVATVPVGALEYTRALAPESVGDDATTVTIRVCEHFERHGACNRGHRCRAAHCPARRVKSASRHPDRCEAVWQCTMMGASELPSSVHDGAGPSPAPVTPNATSDPPSSFTADRDAAAHSGRRRNITNTVRTSRGWRHAAYDAVAVRS